MNYYKFLYIAYPKDVEDICEIVLIPRETIVPASNEHEARRTLMSYLSEGGFFCKEIECGGIESNNIDTFGL